MEMSEDKQIKKEVKKEENVSSDKVKSSGVVLASVETPKASIGEKKISEKKDEKKFGIEDLPGVGAATAEKLREAGFHDLISIAVASPGQLVEASGVGETVARKIINTARDKAGLGFETGEELFNKRLNVTKISTGSNEFNRLLGGGVETGAITEAFGAYGSGKTSLAHQLAFNVQLPKDQGGADGIAVYIDSEGTLRPEYVKQIAEARGSDGTTALKNLIGVRSFNSDHQMLLAEKVEDLIRQGKNVKLVIVDSLTGHFRSDFQGRGMLADRQQKLNKHMHSLLNLAVKNDLAVYVTNQVMARPDTFFGDPTEAIGGHVVAHACLPQYTLLQLGDGSILPIGEMKGPIIMPGVNFGEMQVNLSYCDYGSKRNDIKEVYEIDTGNKIKTSGEHKFFRLNGFEVEKVAANSLMKGDYLMHLDAIEIEGKLQELPLIENKALIQISEEGGNFIKAELQRLGLRRIDVCSQLQINPRQFRRVVNQSYPTYSEVVDNLVEQGVNDKVYSYIEPCETNKHRVITMPKILDERFAQLLGYHLGDGNLDKRSLRYRDQRIEIIKHYAQVCKDLFNIDGKISKVKDKNCYQLSVNSLAIRELVSKIKDKLFLLISRSPKEVVRAFILGFMDAEGYVAKNRPLVVLTQKDGQVLNYLQMLLLRFKIRSKRSVVEKKDGRKSEQLIFQGRDFVDFAREIGVTASDKADLMDEWLLDCEMQKYDREIIPISRETLYKLIEDCSLKPSSIMVGKSSDHKFLSRRNLGMVFNALKILELKEENREKVRFMSKLLSGEVRWEKVRDVKVMENNEPLYDISVSGLTNYIANGFVVSNSTYRLYLRRGKKGTRVAKLVDAPALPEGEIVFQVTEKGIQDAQV